MEKTQKPSIDKLFLWLLSLRIASILFCISPLAPLFTNINDGFAPSKITSNLPYRSDWEVTRLDAESAKALNQDYHYLGKGAQSYAFFSDDGQYVLKLFKHQHLKEPLWHALLPKPMRSKSAYRKQVKLETLFNSYKTAYRDLSDETGVLLVHLNLGGDLPTSSFFDMMGKEHKINLSETSFVLQRRATLITKALKTATNEEAKAIIQRAKETVARRCQKGYIDTDPAFTQNWGVTASGDVIQIDAGRLVKKENISVPSRVASETAQLRTWCEENL